MIRALRFWIIRLEYNFTNLLDWSEAAEATTAPGYDGSMDTSRISPIIHTLSLVQFGSSVRFWILEAMQKNKSRVIWSEVSFQDGKQDDDEKVRNGEHLKLGYAPAPPVGYSNAATKIGDKSVRFVPFGR